MLPSTTISSLDVVITANKPYPFTMWNGDSQLSSRIAG